MIVKNSLFSFHFVLFRLNFAAVSKRGKKAGIGAEMNLVSVLQSEKKLVDVAWIEPVTPCLQSIGLDSIRSIHYFQLLTFPTNRGICFSLKAIPNGMRTLDSCTVRAQRRVGSGDPTIDRSP
jgi:hypothetical protein